MIKEQGDTVKAALTIHGGSTPLVTKSIEEHVAKEDVIHLKKAQEFIAKLANNKEVEITACQISLNRHQIEKKEVVDYVKISPNSFIETIAYQNDGYALMTLK
jgi:intracellular sulfur oxidation DsrE/DsrF family protein